jgi:hypothetical protein
MILVIDTWKDEVRRLKDALVVGCNQNNDFEIEKNLYYLAIVLRKLIQNRLAPRNLGSRRSPIKAYQPTQKVVDALNYLDARTHYDFDCGNDCQKSTKRILDILIHSSFLDWRLHNGIAVELLFASDRTPTALGIEVKKFVSLVEAILDAKFTATPLLAARRT